MVPSKLLLVVAFVAVLTTVSDTIAVSSTATASQSAATSISGTTSGTTRSGATASGSISTSRSCSVSNSSSLGTPTMSHGTRSPSSSASDSRTDTKSHGTSTKHTASASPSVSRSAASPSPSASDSSTGTHTHRSPSPSASDSSTGTHTHRSPSPSDTPSDLRSGSSTVSSLRGSTTHSPSQLGTSVTTSVNRTRSHRTGSGSTSLTALADTGSPSVSPSPSSSAAAQSASASCSVSATASLRSRSASPSGVSTASPSAANASVTLSLSPTTSRTLSTTRSRTRTAQLSNSTSSTLTWTNSSSSTRSYKTLSTFSLSWSQTHLMTKPPTPTTTLLETLTEGTATRSASLSPTASPSAAATHSDATESSTLSHSVSHTVTPPPTPSTSTTLRLTPSDTNSAPVSPSASYQASLSLSYRGLTDSASISASHTAQASSTPSYSITRSGVSKSPSNSNSAPPSQTATPTISQQSATADLSPTTTKTPTHSETATTAVSASPTATDSPSRSGSATHSVSTSLETSASASVSVSESACTTATETVYFTYSREPSKSSTPSLSKSVVVSASSSSSSSQTRDLSITRTQSDVASVSASGSTTATTSASASWSATHTAAATDTPSGSDTRSDSQSASASETPSRTLTTTIDPCNTTFRANASHFIDSLHVGADVLAFAPLTPQGEYFLTINRVQFTLLRTIAVDVYFNTLLRNFYYNVESQWFLQPSSVGCRLAGSRALNASSLRVELAYDIGLMRSISVHDDLVCNVTFSTDIFQCQLLTNQSFNFSLALLAKSMDPLVPTTVLQAFSSTSSIIASAMGAAAMLAQSRAAAIMVFNDCQFSIVDDIEFPDNVLGLQFGVAENRFQRGTVIGNLSFVAGVALLLMAGITMHCVWTRRHVGRGARGVVGNGREAGPGGGAAGGDQELASMPVAHERRGGSDSASNLSEDLLGLHQEREKDYDPLFDDDDPSPIGRLATDQQHRHVDMLRAFPAANAAPSPMHRRVLQKVQRVGSTAASTVVNAVAEPWDAWRHSAAKCRFPSILIIPISFVYDATASSSMSIVLYPQESYDLGLGIFGLTMSALVLVALGVNVMRHFPLRLVRTHRKNAYPVLQRHRWLRYLLYPRAHWSSRPKRNTRDGSGRGKDDQASAAGRESTASFDDPFSDVNSSKNGGMSSAMDAHSRAAEDDGGTRVVRQGENVAGGGRRNEEADLRLFKSSYHFVFDDLAWPAYTLLEFVASFVVGVCVAIGISDRRVCLFLAVVSIAPVALTCAVLLRMHPILTRASFFFTTATNLCCLASCMLVLVSMAGSTDALEQYPALLAFLGVAVTLLRSLTEYSVFGMWLWYTICGKGGSDKGDGDAANGTESPPHGDGAGADGERRRNATSRSKLLVMAVLAESSDDDSDESYDSAKSGSATPPSSGRLTPDGGLIAVPSSCDGGDDGRHVATPHVPLQQLGMLDHEIALAFDDGGSSNGGDCFDSSVVGCAELDASIAYQQRKRRGLSTVSTAAASSGRLRRSQTVVDATQHHQRPNEENDVVAAEDGSKEEEWVDPLTVEERQDLARYAALKADIHATLSMPGAAIAGGSSGAETVGVGSGVRSRKPSNHPGGSAALSSPSGGGTTSLGGVRTRAISTAAPPRDVMRRFSADAEDYDDPFSGTLVGGVDDSRQRNEISETLDALLRTSSHHTEGGDNASSVYARSNGSGDNGSPFVA